MRSSPAAKPRQQQRPRCRGRASLLVAVALTHGCARVPTETVTTAPRAGAPVTVRSGPPSAHDEIGRRVIARDLDATWERGDGYLIVRVTEARQCQLIERVPVRRTVTTRRKLDPGVYFLYALAAVALGVAAYAYARPADFSSSTKTDASGAAVENLAPGYLTAGILTVGGSVALGAAIVQTARARKETRLVEGYAVREGPVESCAPPRVPAVGRRVRVRVGGEAREAVTDADGVARLAWPGDASSPALFVDDAPVEWREHDAASAEAPLARVEDPG
ncbi:MAG: hypothetical protein KC636_15725 [Myxococcales bacterium]|nr:hypothetical protein [Myxococcales bacterium]